MHMLQLLFYLTISLHVSGIIITHNQEHETTVSSASGNRYTVIDRVKFLLLRVPFLFCCGAATQSGSWPPHSWRFLDHTQQRTTVGRISLDE
jgi:hypothetical protein